MADENSTKRDTCLKLELPLESDPKSKESIFIKGTWFSSRFDLAITDGLNAWTCNASEAEVRKRAEQWDQPVAEYVELMERYLGFQQPGSKYNFQDAGDGHRRLSWTFEKEGTKLEWRWKCQPSSDSKQTTVAILDFLMDANIRLSEEVVRKTQSFERLKGEAEKCLSQSEKFRNEKIEFESAVYAKFVAVLNSKKAKLRELRDRISKLEAAGKGPAADDVSSNKTETFDEGTDEEKKKEAPAGEKPEPVRTQSTHLRNMIIVPEMIWTIIRVYNGKTFNQVEIKPEMIGHCLAEFSLSYKPVKHGRPGLFQVHSSQVKQSCA